MSPSAAQGAGSLVGRYCYDPYGKPLIRESLGRGDQRGQDTILALGDGVDFAATTAAQERNSERFPASAEIS